MSNALAYTPTGSPLEIVATLEPSDGTTSTRAKILVVDHGGGIAPEAASHVFERFWRSDPARVRSHGGAGSGLSIVAAIADAHGGRVSLWETPGGGATFVVELPTEPEPDRSLGSDTASAGNLTGNGAATGNTADVPEAGVAEGGAGAGIARRPNRWPTSEAHIAGARIAGGDGTTPAATAPFSGRQRPS